MRCYRLWGLSLLAFAGAMTLNACADRSPVAPQSPVERPEIDIAAGGQLSGQVITIVRELDRGNALGTVIAADTSAFAAAIAPNGSSVARLAVDGKAVELVVALSDEAVEARRGQWAVDAGRKASGPARSIILSAENGAPPSTATYVSGGSVVARVATQWTRARGGWLVASRTLTLYRDGKPSRSISTTLDDPRGTQIAYSPTSAGRANFSAGISRHVGDEPCQPEFNAMFDAIDAYWAADAALIACLGGPLPCLGAGIAVLYMARKMDVASYRLDRCLASGGDNTAY